MDITLSKLNTAHWALTNTICHKILYAFLAENMWTCLKHYRPLPLGTTSAHYLRFVLLHLHLNGLILRFLFNRLQKQS